jgi:5'-methylthioadenosine phosphorylase
MTNTIGSPPVEIAIIGGSGLYEMAGLQDVEAISLETPFGTPSDHIMVGRLGERRVGFLPRHGRQHGLLPAELNFRANIYALKSLGVERILSASAVGSMREDIHPRDVVLIDQFIDRTHGRISTFFGDGVVAHVGFADPICPDLRKRMLSAAEGRVPRVHDGGTYVCIDGPAFSTRAESELYRSWNVDVIGMTNLQEAKLAREAEICYASLALVTDYDCWNTEEEDVNVAALLENLKANAAAAGEVIREAILSMPGERLSCACGSALASAIITPPASISADTRRRLGPILSRHLPA